jgi:tryptophan synthase alpha subunit
VRQVVSEADAAIVGSALMRQVEAHRDSDRDKLIEAVSRFARELAGGLELDPANRTADVGR